MANFGKQKMTELIPQAAGQRRKEVQTSAGPDFPISAYASSSAANNPQKNLRICGLKIVVYPEPKTLRLVAFGGIVRRRSSRPGASDKSGHCTGRQSVHAVLARHGRELSFVKHHQPGFPKLDDR
jgi:hypothetical protein